MFRDYLTNKLMLFILAKQILKHRNVNKLKKPNQTSPNLTSDYPSVRSIIPLLFRAWSGMPTTVNVLL